MKLFGFYDNKHDPLLMEELWFAQVPAWLAFIPVRLSCEESLDEPAAYVTERLEPNEPYAFFGYRAGANHALELAGGLMQAGQPMPVHLLLAGANPPHVNSAGGGRKTGDWEPLPSRFSILSGQQDPDVLPERLNEWSRYTQDRCHIHSLAGGSAAWTAHPEQLIRSCLLILEREYATERR